MTNSLIEDKNTANYTGFSLVSGGLIYKLTSVFRGKGDTRKGIRRTAFALVIITWLPVCILALLNGTLNDDNTTISFFEDFLFHIRFLFVVPFLILIEKIVDHSFIEYIKNSDYLIPDSQQERFNRMVKRLDKLTDSYWPEIIILIVIYSLIYFNWEALTTFNGGRNYLLHKGTTELNAAGWYYLLVSSPILVLLIFRWLWRWVIWVYSVINISRFKLQTDPFHADQMAGLSYINLSALNFSFVMVAISAIIAADLGINIIYHDVVLKSYFMPISFYLVILTILLYAPFTLFMPLLLKAKSYGVRKFGNLIRKHNRDYAEKWIEGSPSNDEKILGSIDNSSLADINGSYGPIQGLKIVPISSKMFILSFLLNALPFIPLVFTYYSIADLFKILTSSVFGG